MFQVFLINIYHYFDVVLFSMRKDKHFTSFYREYKKTITIPLCKWKVRNF